MLEIPASPAVGSGEAIARYERFSIYIFIYEDWQIPARENCKEIFERLNCYKYRNCSFGCLHFWKKA